MGRGNFVVVVRVEGTRTVEDVVDTRVVLFKGGRYLCGWGGCLITNVPPPFGFCIVTMPLLKWYNLKLWPLLIRKLFFSIVNSPIRPVGLICGPIFSRCCRFTWRPKWRWRWHHKIVCQIMTTAGTKHKTIHTHTQMNPFWFYTFPHKHTRPFITAYCTRFWTYLKILTMTRTC